MSTNLRSAQKQQIGGLGAEASAAGGQRVFGRSPQSCENDFFSFFQKNKAFLCILWSKLLLKNVF